MEDIDELEIEETEDDEFKVVVPCEVLDVEGGGAKKEQTEKEVVEEDDEEEEGGYDGNKNLSDDITEKDIKDLSEVDRNQFKYFSRQKTQQQNQIPAHQTYATKRPIMYSTIEAFKRSKKPHTSRISMASIKRLARRASVKRMGKSVAPEIRKSLTIFIENILKDSVIFMEHSRRKTLSLDDVLNALHRNGKKLYGW